MPHKKVLQSLTEMSVNCLANLVASGLDPQFLLNLKLKDSSDLDANNAQKNLIISMPEVERTCDTGKENVPDNQAYQKEINEYEDHTGSVEHKPLDELNVIQETSLIDEHSLVKDSINMVQSNNKTMDETFDLLPTVSKMDNTEASFESDNILKVADTAELDFTEEGCTDLELTEKEGMKAEFVTVEEKEPLIVPEENKNLLEIAQEFLVCLAQFLASHTHCTLQELIFSSILTPLNRLYVKHRSPEMRTLIRKIAPLFINASLRTLDFGSFRMFTEASMFQVIYRRLKEASGLKKLVFGRSCYWRSKSMTNLSKVLEGMQSLSVLHVHYICQPHMLQGLSDSCPQLQELSLKGSKDITNKEVPLMLGFIHLETLDISGTSITGRGSRSLVLNLPKLSWFTHCPFNCNSDTLIFESRAELFSYIKDQLTRQPVITRSSEGLSIQPPLDLEPAQGEPEQSGTTPPDVMQGPESAESDSKPQAVMTLNLKSFWLFNTTTEELLLTQICPYLEHLRLDFVMQDLPEIPDMEAMGALPHLSSLALYTYDRCPIQLVTSVIDFASRLTTLHLHLGDEWFFVAPVANVIVQNCRNLESLTMEGDYKGQHSLEESDARLDFTLPPEGLRHLVTATLSGCVTDLRLLHLLSHAPNLETLYLDGELEWIHDETIADAIRRNLLSHIKVLWFNVSAGVTFSSVRRLLQSENELERIGRLCLMSSATKDGYQDLLYLTKRFNISTELVWVTDQRQLHIGAISRPSE